MLIGITTPEKFYFDEVHYVPAARQMLEPVMPQPMLNPMHPPLAKQIIALSIHAFGDVPLGWRYPAVLFGALAHRRGVSLRPRAVRRPGAGDRGKPARLLQPDAVRAIADRDAGYFRADLRPVRHRGVPPWLPAAAAASLVRAGRARFRLLDRLQMERAVRARGLHRHRGGDPPDAKLAHAICRRQCRRLVPARSLARLSRPGISRRASC